MFQEETGLDVKDVLRNQRILCLWESVYPYILSMGQPKRHHVVVYLHLSLNTAAMELRNTMILDPEEVDAAMWLDPTLASLVAEDKVPDTCPPEIQIMCVDKTGHMSTKWIAASVMTNAVSIDNLRARVNLNIHFFQAPTQGEDIERVSTGTRYALAQWLKTKKSDI